MMKKTIKFIIITLLLSVLFLCILLTVMTKTGMLDFEKPSDTLIVTEDTPIDGEFDLSEPVASEPAVDTEQPSKGIIVLDPGHGVSSSSMTADDKKAAGWKYEEGRGWGEWRHFKSGTLWEDCHGFGCNGRAPSNGGCWYPIGYGDRSIEPEINLNNAYSAKKYLEDMGYTVRITRDASENPSMSKRLTYCYPDGDITKAPDADAYICLHSNAGGGHGSYYISLSGLYDHAYLSENYINSGNALGKCINDRIVAQTPLAAASGGRYDGYPTLVLFMKSPITIAYMEIGFFDNASDLAILRESYDEIGKAVADGIDDYMSGTSIE